MIAGLILALLAAPEAPAERAQGDPWPGPGRYCGYATEIDLAEGETISTRRLGLHGAAFEWAGKFGTIEVREINWASKPAGRPIHIDGIDRLQVVRVTRPGPGPTYALWSDEHLAAYVSGPAFRSKAAVAGILRRIELVDHAGERSENCKYRTLFSWE